MKLMILAAAGLISIALPAQNAHADEGGTLGVKVTGRYVAGHTSGLPGASVIAKNVSTGEEIKLVPYGDPQTSHHFQAKRVPWGHYQVRAQALGFVSTHWPRQFAESSAGLVTFSPETNCNPADSASCAVHALGIELPQPVSLTGTAKTRSGKPVVHATVTARNLQEIDHTLISLTGLDGRYMLSLPPGSFRIDIPNGQQTKQYALAISGPSSLNLLLDDRPQPPTNVKAKGGDEQATVSWDPPLDDGGSPISAYQVTATPGGAGCRTSGTVCNVRGLRNGEAYQFRVAAQNPVGSSDDSPASVWTRVAPAIPGPPSRVRVRGTDSAIDVNWSASASKDVVEYVATARPGGLSCSTEGLTCTISNLRNGKNYTVSVRARNGFSESASSPSSLLVRPIAAPSPPRNVETLPRPASLLVTWNRPLDNGGTPVEQYVATAWPGGKTCRTKERLSCRIRGLAPGTAYSITLRAQHYGGTSLSSPGSSPKQPTVASKGGSRIKGLKVIQTRSWLTARWVPLRGAEGYLVRWQLHEGTHTHWTLVRLPSVSIAVRRDVERVEIRPLVEGTRTVLTTKRIGN